MPDLIAQALLTLEKQEVHKLNNAFIQVSKQKEIAEEQVSHAHEELASKTNENAALHRIFENLMNGSVSLQDLPNIIPSTQ
ncbi:hypothetical protein DXG01_014129 [Tephrocybe rancida]|nr:hypothetical protein DXG01_014129 [Tephrocybe rancida]